MIGLDMRVENERCGHLLFGKPVEQVAKEHGLAGAYFTGQEDQAFASANRVGKLVRGGASLIGYKEKTWVGIDLERVFAQTEEIEDCLAHDAKNSEDSG